jgi:hypothetical protein
VAKQLAWSSLPSGIQLSGIGPKDVLEKAGVQVHHILEGVGEFRASNLSPSPQFLFFLFFLLN